MGLCRKAPSEASAARLKELQEGAEEKALLFARTLVHALGLTWGTVCKYRLSLVIAQMHS